MKESINQSDSACELRTGTARAEMLLAPTKIWEINAGGNRNVMKRYIIPVTRTGTIYPRRSVLDFWFLIQLWIIDKRQHHWHSLFIF